uniref:Uncharacterized protein n=1 Tax=Craspedostauros australis TaxID=1486917 RepID=A0A7R9WVK0_9STRA
MAAISQSMSIPVQVEWMTSFHYVHTTSSPHRHHVSTIVSDQSTSSVLFQLPTQILREIVVHIILIPVVLPLLIVLCGFFVGAPIRCLELLEFVILLDGFDHGGLRGGRRVLLLLALLSIHLPFSL